MEQQQENTAKEDYKPKQSEERGCSKEGCKNSVTKFGSLDGYKCKVHVSEDIRNKMERIANKEKARGERVVCNKEGCKEFVGCRVCVKCSKHHEEEMEGLEEKRSKVKRLNEDIEAESGFKHLIEENIRKAEEERDKILSDIEKIKQEINEDEKVFSYTCSTCDFIETKQDYALNNKDGYEVCYDCFNEVENENNKE